jgi:hypothetical protein
MLPAWKERKISKYLRRNKAELFVKQSFKDNNKTESSMYVAEYVASL